MVKKEMYKEALPSEMPHHTMLHTRDGQRIEFRNVTLTIEEEEIKGRAIIRQ